MTPFLIVLVALVALPLLAVAAELAVRFWLRHRNAYYVFSPGLRIRLHPDPVVFPQLEPVVRFEVNGEGERGDEVPSVSRHEKLYRVLVGGGSQLEGYSLDQPTSWPCAVQRLLQQPEHLRRIGATKVHVGNIARSGVGSEALDLILERVLPRYPRLQAIIILVGVSDVLHWLEEGAPARAHSPVRVSDVFKCHPEGPFGWKPNTLAVAELFTRLRHRWLRPVEVHQHAGRWVAKVRAMRARAKEIRTTMPDATPMLDHFEARFRSVLQRAKAHAERVIVLRQFWFDKDYSPEEAACMWHGGVGQAWREELTTYYSFEVVSKLMTLLDARATRVANELDVEQLELRPLLEPTLENFYDCFHLTPTGSRAVAPAVAAAILRQPVQSMSTSDRFTNVRLVDAHSMDDRRGGRPPIAARSALS